MRPPYGTPKPATFDKQKTVADNRRVRFDYFEETFEAGPGAGEAGARRVRRASRKAMPRSATGRCGWWCQYSRYSPATDWIRAAPAAQTAAQCARMAAVRRGRAQGHDAGPAVGLFHLDRPGQAELAWPRASKRMTSARQ